MRHSLPLPALALFLGLWFGAVLPARAGGWSSRSGEKLAGDPVAFDFEGKTVTFHDSISNQDRVMPARSLSFRSRQKLLFSPLFHRGGRSDSLWPPAKRRLLLFALAIPAVIFFFTFWAAAWGGTGTFNPFLALIGFLGSWVIIGIFAVCYSLLQIRIDGGFKVIAVGMVVALFVTPLYLSAVYNCTYGKGHFILFSHFLAGVCILGFGLYSVELALGEKLTESLWDKIVFEPLGLIAPEESPPGRDP